MASQDRERRWKRTCCEKPPRKACKRCPRRRRAAEPSAERPGPQRDQDEPNCPFSCA